MGLHHVVTLLLDDCVLLDVAIPVHVFGYRGDGRYRHTLAGHRRGPARRPLPVGDGRPQPSPALHPSSWHDAHRLPTRLHAPRLTTVRGWAEGEPVAASPHRVQRGGRELELVAIERWIVVPGAPYDDPHDLRLRGTVLPTGSRCLVMGVINVTPDSFSDGGRYLDPETAVRHGLTLASGGADLLDVGGESTRPGAQAVDAETELARVLPVVEGLRQATGVPISVDTRKAVVARAALGLGASMINDVSAGRDDPELLPAVARAGAAVVLMHMQGTPATMQDNPRYADVVTEVEAFLAARCAAAERAGVDRSSIVVDPGIGFGKNDAHNYALLGGLAGLTRLGHPVLAGVSRKGFIGRALGNAPVDQRLEGTAAVVAWVVERGARIVRVHDVAAMRKVVQMTEALVRGSAPTVVAERQ